MIEYIHKITLWIHIPFGFLSLVLFWIPVAVKKGGSLHKKVGWFYYISMWVVLVTSAIMSVCNLFMDKYIAALYLGFLALVTTYPLWYSYEILRQQKEWSNRYFWIRKTFVVVMFLSGVGMILLAGIKFHFQNMGVMMAFFGVLTLPAGRDILMTKAMAMDKETKLKMHIQGTIITGIAAYTAFFAFGGNRILMQVFHLPVQWMILPWILPTILGLIYSRYMKKKYRVA